MDMNLVNYLWIVFVFDLILTAPIHCIWSTLWANGVMLHIYKCVLIKLTPLPIGWPEIEYIFIKLSFLDDYSFNASSFRLVCSHVFGTLQKVKSRTQGLLVFRKCHFGCARICVHLKLSLHFYFRWGNNSSVIGSQNFLPHRCGKTHLMFPFMLFPDACEFHRWGKQIFRSYRISSTLSNLLSFIYVQPHNPTVNLRTLLFYTTMKYMKLVDADAVTINSPFMDFIL